MRFYEWQKDAFVFCADKSAFALYMKMRLGKSHVYIRRMQNEPDDAKHLLITPNETIHDWISSLKKANEHDVVVVSGNGKNRLKQLIQWPRFELGRWTIIHPESVLVTKEIADLDFSSVCIDESTIIKNPRAGITKFCLKNLRDIPIRVLLTGTPAPENELDFFTQMDFLKPGILGSNFYRYRDYNFAKFGYKFKIKPTARTAILKKVKTVAFFASYKDYKITFRIQRRERFVSLDSKTLDKIKKLKDDFILELNSGKEIKTIYKCVQHSLLRRIGGGIIKHEDGAIEKVHDKKFELIERDVTTEFADDKIVIWAVYVPEILEIQKRLKTKNVLVDAIYGNTPKQDRDRIKENFQSGKTRVIVANPSIFRFGLDLSVADTVLWFSTTLSNQTREQASARVLKIGKRRGILEVDYITRGTADAAAINKIKYKKSNSEYIHTLGRYLKNDSLR